MSGLPFDEDDDDGIAHGTGEGWGSPEDLAAVVHHVQSTPPGVDPWGLDERALLRAAGKKNHDPFDTRVRVAAGDGDPDADDFPFDDDDVYDPAPEGVWTPPRYDEDGDYGPTGGLYGDHHERYLEDLYHGHLVDLDDQELIDAYEHQRTRPDFKGSDLENAMWTAVTNRIETHHEREDTDPDGDWGQHQAVVDYFNGVHGCTEHFFTPPDQHEPHGNFGDPEPDWNPDNDVFDPRVFGASRDD